METIWEYKLKNGIIGAFDVREINSLYIYEYDSKKGGLLKIFTKDGKDHEISGYHSDKLTKKVTTMYCEIIEMKRKLNNRQQYD